MKFMFSSLVFCYYFIIFPYLFCNCAKREGRHIHIKHPSLILECKSLMAMRTLHAPCSFTFSFTALSDEWDGDCDEGTGTLLSNANTSTIHSYQTFRLSVWRYMVTSIWEFSG